jgi:hypothetical protein
VAVAAHVALVGDAHVVLAAVRSVSKVAEAEVVAAEKILQIMKAWRFRGRLHSAFSMCVSMSDKPFDAEACDIGRQASATNGLSDMKTHIENAPCNRPLTGATSGYRECKK